MILDRGPLRAASILVIGAAFSISGVHAAPYEEWVHGRAARRTVEFARKELERAPDDAEAMTLLLVGLSRWGRSSEALSVVPWTLGAELYEDRGILAHADALRAVGAGREAALLRQQRLLVDPLPETLEVRISVDVLDDYRESRAFQEAFDWAARLEAQYPRATTVQAALADLCLDVGDEECAGAHLWLAAGMGDAQRLHAVRARWALALGLIAEARAELEEARRFRSPSPRLAALRVDVELASGDVEAALDAAEGAANVHGEAPEVQAARLRVLVAAGQGQAARDLASSLVALCPQQSDVRAAIRETGLR